MAESAPAPWLSRSLFWGTVLTACLLILLVLGAPWLENSRAWPIWFARLGGLFANDRTVRRTVFASALGLVATAYVFFRTPVSKAAPPVSDT